MNNNTIRFSCNWNNKLTNKAFTTLRIHNPSKYVVGRVYDIEFNGKPDGQAIIQDIRVIRIQQLNDFSCYLDTGYSREQTIGILRKMYPKIDLNNTSFDFCLLVRQPQPTKPQPQQMNFQYND